MKTFALCAAAWALGFFACATTAAIGLVDYKTALWHVAYGGDMDWRIYGSGNGPLVAAPPVDFDYDHCVAVSEVLQPYKSRGSWSYRTTFYCSNDWCKFLTGRFSLESSPAPRCSVFVPGLRPPVTTH